MQIIVLEHTNRETKKQKKTFTKIYVVATCSTAGTNSHTQKSSHNAKTSSTCTIMRSNSCTWCVHQATAPNWLNWVIIIIRKPNDRKKNIIENRMWKAYASVQWLRICIAAPPRILSTHQKSNTEKIVHLFLPFCRTMLGIIFLRFFFVGSVLTSPTVSKLRAQIYFFDAYKHGRTHCTHTCGQISAIDGDVFMIVPQLSEPISPFRPCVRSIKYKNYKIFDKCIRARARTMRSGRVLGQTTTCDNVIVNFFVHRVLAATPRHIAIHFVPRCVAYISI